MSRVCSEDCFNCKHDDCILENPKPERELSQDPDNIRRRNHYRANRERICAQKRAYHQANKERINARRRKPPKPLKTDYKGLCFRCKHFIRRSRGKKGGLWGMCDVSVKDCRNFKWWGFTRPVGFRNKCSKFEEETNEIHESERKL